MIYCAKHRRVCKHLFQRPIKGSFCGNNKEPVESMPHISNKIYGDIKAPDWCPLKEDGDEK